MSKPTYEQLELQCKKLRQDTLAITKQFMQEVDRRRNLEHQLRSLAILDVTDEEDYQTIRFSYRVSKTALQHAIRFDIIQNMCERFAQSLEEKFKAAFKPKLPTGPPIPGWIYELACEINQVRDVKAVAHKIFYTLLRQ